MTHHILYEGILAKARRLVNENYYQEEHKIGYIQRGAEEDARKSFFVCQEMPKDKTFPARTGERSCHWRNTLFSWGNDFILKFGILIMDLGILRSLDGISLMPEVFSQMSESLLL